MGDKIMFALEVGQEFDNFGEGVYEKIPFGAVFACPDDFHAPYVYDPYFQLKRKEYCVRAPGTGWALITVAHINISGAENDGA